MNFKEIKKEARSSLRYHLFISILICFVVTLVISNGYKFNTTNRINTNDPVTSSLTKTFIDTNNIYTIEDFAKRTKIYSTVTSITDYKPTRGVLSVFFNQINGTGSIIIGILNANNQFFFHNSLPSKIIYALSIIIYLFVFIFVHNIIIIGKNRYFLEHRKYQDTSFDKLLFVYKVSRVKNVALIMIMKTIKTFLWWFTIVMGPIKFYEYSMIPYILAENPEVDYKECFRVSKEMTKGYKLDLFKMDLSLIVWYILGYVTLGISNIFYFTPYKESINVCMYMNLREKIRKNNKKVFKDRYIEGENTKGEYPFDKYFIEEVQHRKWIKNDYKLNLSYLNMILIFFTFSILGYLWEVFYTFLNEGIIVNRGTMFGPWVPIYGWGAILIISSLIKLKDKPFYLFIGSFILSGVLEYSTSWYLETFNHMKWWDYSGYFLNINGRVCLEGLLVFALAGCIAIYFIIPHLDNIYKKISYNAKLLIAIILICLYSIDFIYSTINPNTGEGITTKVSVVIKNIV